MERAIHRRLAPVLELFFLDFLIFCPWKAGVNIRVQWTESDTLYHDTSTEYIWANACNTSLAVQYAADCALPENNSRQDSSPVTKPLGGDPVIRCGGFANGEGNELTLLPYQETACAVLSEFHCP